MARDHKSNSPKSPNREEGSSEKNSESVSFIEGVIEIRDPSINVPQLIKQIRENMASRKAEGFSLGSVVLSEERLALRAIHETLRVRVLTYGTLGEPEPGLIGKIRFLVKRVVLKLIRRFIDQERDVQESLLKFIECLIPYLDQVQNSADCLKRIEKLENRLEKTPV